MNANQEILNKIFRNTDVPYVTQRIEQETAKEKIIRIAHFPGSEQKDYVLTNNSIYIFEGQQGCKFVSCRKSKLRDVFEFHFYRKGDVDNIAVITKPGHVVFVLKFDNYLQALVFLRELYKGQVLEIPDQNPNTFRAIDINNQIKYGNTIGG